MLLSSALLSLCTGHWKTSMIELLIELKSGFGTCTVYLRPKGNAQPHSHDFILKFILNTRQWMRQCVKLEWGDEVREKKYLEKYLESNVFPIKQPVTSKVNNHTTFLLFAQLFVLRHLYAHKPTHTHSHTRTCAQTNKRTLTPLNPLQE